MSNKNVTVIHRKDKEVVLTTRELVELYVLSTTDESCKKVIAYGLTKTNSFMFSPYSVGC